MQKNDDINNFRDLRDQIKNFGFKKMVLNKEEEGLRSITGYWIGKSGILKIDYEDPNKLLLEFIYKFRITFDGEIKEDTNFKKID